MPLLRIKLEKGDKIPNIRTAEKKRIDWICPNCKQTISIYYCEWEGEKYFRGECWDCGYKFAITPEQCDYIQPNSPLFEIYYKFHPEKEKEKKRKQKEFEEKQRKAKLEEKYWRNPRLKSWEKKALNKIVLQEK